MKLCLIFIKVFKKINMKDKCFKNILSLGQFHIKKKYLKFSHGYIRSNERNKRNNSNYRVAQTQMMTHTKGEPHGLPQELFSLNRPLGRFSHRVAMSVCLSVCVRVRHTLETTLPDGLETSGRRAYR